MTIRDAIDVRTSRRSYLEQDLTTSQLEKMNKLINQFNKIGGFKIQLVTNDGKAFKGFSRSYGMFKGVCHYFVFIADTSDLHADEKIGYYGQLLVLHATTLGLGTCWVGGTFSKSKTPVTLSNNERIACLITIGMTPEENTKKEKFIHKLTHRKSKTAEQMYHSDTAVPKWFHDGMLAVTKAPSAMNQQPVCFTYQNKKTTAMLLPNKKHFVDMDLGIAKLHFEIGAGGGTWNWGKEGRFKQLVS